MSSRSYLSIGDVLTLLRQEFPDVTISKIRFLESQGLVNPERTPSGYRKFYEHDVERLRWVLRQQREHFLPLKVIKDRLDDEDGGGTTGAAHAPTPVTPVPAVAAAGGHRADTEEAAVLVGPGARVVDADGSPDPTTGLPGIESVTRHRAPARAVAGAASIPGPPASATPDVTVAPVERAHRASLATPSTAPAVHTADAGVATAAANGAANGASGPGPSAHAAPVDDEETPAPKPPKATSRRAAGAPARARATAAASSGSGGADGDPPATGFGVGGASLSLEDLCAASGLSAAGIAELQEYGLLSATVAAGVEFFDEEALAVANLAAKFAAFGIEARHLRLYKNAADREAGFIEQIVIPMVRQRNPEARARATQTAEELSRLGQQMKASLLRSALRDIL